MRKLKSILLLLIGMIALTTLVSCEKDNNAKSLIIGAWEEISDSADILTFTPNGKGSYDGVNFNYVLEDGYIYMTEYDGNRNLIFKIMKLTKTEMILEYDDSQMRYKK